MSETDGDGGNLRGDDGGSASVGDDAGGSIPGEPTEQPSDVDVLLVLDNSGSMRNLHRRLKSDFVELGRTLVTGDYDEDGTVDFRPVDSVRFGVITSDLGVGENFVPTCPDANGDDAQLLSVGEGSSCGDGEARSFVEFRRASGAGEEAVIEDLSCLAQLTREMDGCGFEQPLEATLKAITSAENGDLTFADGTRGHGSGANAGFLRDDALLVIVFLTDEDDCSARDTGLFDIADTELGSPDLRCARYEDRLHPVTRFVEGVLDVRKGDASRVVMGVVAGVPGDLLESDRAVDYQSVLRDERMQYELDTESEQRLMPACFVETRGEVRGATPARRLVQTLHEMELRGVTTALASVCEDDWTPIVSTVLRRLNAD